MSDWLDDDDHYSDQDMARFVVKELARRQGLQGEDFAWFLLNQQMKIYKMLVQMRRQAETSALINPLGARLVNAITPATRDQWISIFVSYVERWDRRDTGWLTEAHMADASRVLHNMPSHTRPAKGEPLGE
jgi:hypothetical protein